MIKFKAKNIVILTGAGISAESGIATFRDQNGLWENHDVMEVASPEGFKKNPELVLDFYNQRRRQLLSNEVAPNQAHIALGELEKRFDGNFTLITQNVDNLHERGGSKNLLHMHGSLLEMRCSKSEEVFKIEADISTTDLCPCCKQSHNLRPNIVWFGEYPMHMQKIHSKLFTCDLFISIGTSGNVYPAAMFVQTAKEAGAYTIEMNLEKTVGSHYFDEHIQGKAGTTLPRLVKDIFAF